MKREGDGSHETYSSSKSSWRNIMTSLYTHGGWKYEEGERRGYVPFGIFVPVAAWSQSQLPWRSSLLTELFLCGSGCAV